MKGCVFYRVYESVRSLGLKTHDPFSLNRSVPVPFQQHASPPTRPWPAHEATGSVNTLPLCWEMLKHLKKDDIPPPLQHWQGYFLFKNNNNNKIIKVYRCILRNLPLSPTPTPLLNFQHHSSFVFHCYFFFPFTSVEVESPTQPGVSPPPPPPNRG